MNLIESIIGGVLILATGGTFKWLNYKVDCKLDKDVFMAEHKAVVKDLEEGKLRFEKIDQKLDRQTECLHNLDTTAQLMQQTLISISNKMNNRSKM